MSDTDWCEWVPTDPIDSIVSPQIVCDFDELVLLKVFKHFPLAERVAFRRVCVKWRDCVDKSMKSEAVIDGHAIGPTGVSMKALCLLVAKCCNVRTLRLKNSFVFKSSKFPTAKDEDNIVTTIVDNCHLLQELDLDLIDDIDDHIVNNIEYFRRLKRIISQNIGEKGLNCLMDSQNLETIDINKNSTILRPEFERLGPKINELILTESEVTDVEIFRNLCEGNGKRVTRLEMDIKDNAVLSQICHHLIELKTFKITLYSQDFDFKFFSNLIHLQSLRVEVSDDSRLTAEELTVLIRSLKSTKLLDLEVILSMTNNIAVNDGSLQEISENCHSLETLVIRRANSMTGAAMSAISQMKHLKHLNLKDCLNINDQIVVVITSCPLLRQLILHNCSHITKAVVDSFMTKADMSPTEPFKLDVIDTNVSQESVPQESERPKNLKILIDCDECEYNDCDHGWDQQNGYNSGPDDDYNDMMDELDFYEEDDCDDFYDDYDDDEDLDYGLS